MILPIGATRFEEALQMGSETYHHLKVSLFEQVFWFRFICFLYANSLYCSNDKRFFKIKFINLISILDSLRLIEKLFS